MITTLAIILCVALAVFMTLGLAGAIYEHRAALPMVGLMFVAIILFGLIW